MQRRHNFQTVSWFHDLHRRKRLNLDPPYQRRSVWNQRFKDDFVDTVLLNYPAPAIFLFEQVDPEGRSEYHVVDGKQRLTTLFEFVSNEFPISDSSAVESLRGLNFASFDDETKKAFWTYQFLVEYVPSDDEELINSIFDRINRNVAKLTPQELRHARLDGEFITACETLSEWMSETLPRNFPRLAPQSRKQMKDIELVALLLLLLEDGPKGYSQNDLDDAFTARDSEWDARHTAEAELREAVGYVRDLLETEPGTDLVNTRLRNQADFYSLIGAIVNLQRQGRLPEAEAAADRLRTFVNQLGLEAARDQDTRLSAYYEAARSASNDKGPREVRIREISHVIASEG